MAVVELKSRVPKGASQSYGGRRTKSDSPTAPPRHHGRTAADIPVSPFVSSIHGSMLASLLRAPPRKAVRKYVLVELKRAGRRMDFDELTAVIACQGYDHNGKACAKHGKGGCGAWEWEIDVDGKGNVVGKWERKLDAATPYEVLVAIHSLLASERIEIVDGQLRLPKKQPVPEALTPKERWRRADEELRVYWQTMDVHETRSVWKREGE